MVHSLVLAIATDSECLMCGDFSLSETIHFGSLEFIADCFGFLNLPRLWKFVEGDLGGILT
jgi:hypothetical protein